MRVPQGREELGGNGVKNIIGSGVGWDGGLLRFSMHPTTGPILIKGILARFNQKQYVVIEDINEIYPGKLRDIPPKEFVNKTG